LSAQTGVTTLSAPAAGNPISTNTGIENNSTPNTKGFPIVGIGASAGGLAMFEAFFSGMPDADTGMAFVLVQHLDPHYKSLLTEIVQRYTKMRAFEVEEGMVVQPNCVYIIPPGRNMACENGTLHLLTPTAPHGQRLPIDFFLASLARDQQERAIAIILSGSGSDGTMGIRAIKHEGGMVMAQKLESAEYDSMPRSAIATGLVDFELPPAEMPTQLVAYIAHAFDKDQQSLVKALPQNESILKKIFLLLQSQTGHDFSDYKLGTIERRIERRMAVKQIATIANYAVYLGQNAIEVDALFRDLLIGVTHFFRDTEAFNELEKQVIPKLFAGKLGGGIIRVWVPGCSTGEEAYSIAILLYEYAEALKQGFKIQVFATDIDSQAIAIARTGTYTGNILADISRERLARFFSTESNESIFRINKNIRDLVIFSEQDIVRDPPFSKLDLVSCRNLLIYLSGELQKKIIPLFHYALNSKGFLFLGNSEGIGEFSDLFSTLDRKSKLYQSKGANHSPLHSALGRIFRTRTGSETSPRQLVNLTPAAIKLPLRELTEKMLLLHMNATAALVNDQGDIFYLHGRTGLYLEPAPGEATVSNVLKMSREGLRRDLTVSLHRAAGTKDIVRHNGVRVKTNGDYTVINLTIKPLVTAATEVPLYVIIFEKANTPLGEPEQNTLGNPTESDSDAYIVSLKKELHSKEEYLQTANEELETSNEELKSSNEEMQSINEELQSANEELETSKEELQSVNEELATVNAELQTKVSDLSRANNDLNNLLAGTGIGTVFVDHQLRIVRFTPAATQIINLIQSDIGRPVSHIVSNLVDYENLIEDTRAVLDTLIPKEMEVQTKAGAWYTLRILPYRTLDNVIEGAVMTFVNISAVKKAEETLRISQDNIRVALLASPVAVFNQDTNLRYTWSYAINPSATPEQVIGKTDADLFGPDDAQKITALKRQVLETGIGDRERIELKDETHTRIFDLTIEPLKDLAGTIIGITSATIDRTEPKEN
jgi:two-component system, chemotaxis family, CheB/CheR fusion protein